MVVGDIAEGNACSPLIFCDSVAASWGVEYRLESFLVAPRNLFSSSLSSDEIIDTCDKDLERLFFRIFGRSFSLLSLLIMIIFWLIVGWILSSCGSMMIVYEVRRLVGLG